jgi:hypothetical protein
MLEQGCAVIVLSNDGYQRLGVLTHDRPLLDDAQVPQLIDAGQVGRIAACRQSPRR